MSPLPKLLRSLPLSALLLLPACSKSEPPPPAAVAQAPKPLPPPASVDPASTARDLYRSRCTLCHGETGHGDGPGGAALTPKPRVFTDADWQATVKDEQLRDIIVKGGAGVGKSPGMPSNPELEQKPEVVGELVKIVRGFKG